MSISVTRAEAVAKILWELKRADKLAKFSSIADRAGFKPGPGGRTMSTCLKTVRREWPHLQWWRAIADNGILDKEQRSHLAESGFETEPVKGETATVASLDDHLMNWPPPEKATNEDDSEAGIDTTHSTGACGANRG